MYSTPIWSVLEDNWVIQSKLKPQSILLVKQIGAILESHPSSQVDWFFLNCNLFFLSFYFYRDWFFLNCNLFFLNLYIYQNWFFLNYNLVFLNIYIYRDCFFLYCNLFFLSLYFFFQDWFCLDWKFFNVSYKVLTYTSSYHRYEF